MRIKTIAVLGMVLLASCSGATNGGLGADGTSGADGKNGVDGADGAPGPAGKDAAESGTRLKAQWRTADDGAREFVGWFDSQLQIACYFVTASDGESRCMPRLVDVAYQKAFTDAQCTTPAYATYAPFEGCPHVGYAVEGPPPSCPYYPTYEVHKLGAKLDANATYYVLSGANCVVFPGATTEVHADGGVVSPSMFVAATIETDP